MADFIWKASKKAVKARELYNDTFEVFYIPESALSQLSKVDSFAKEPEKYEGAKVKIKRVSEFMAKEHESGFIIEEGADVIIPLYYMYLQVTGCGNEPTFSVYKSYTVEGRFFSIEPASEKAMEQFDAWTRDVAYFAEKNIDRLGLGGQETFKNIAFDAEFGEPEYVGKTIDVVVSEDMTFGEFKNNFIQAVGVIPNIFYHKQEVKDKGALLKTIGIKGKTTVKLMPFIAVGDVTRALNEQLNLEGVMVYYKFVNRPWSYMMGDQLLTEANKLPSIWRSICYNVAIKIANSVD